VTREAARDEDSPWGRAALVASLFAVDPVASGGVALRAMAGPVRDRWLALLRELLAAQAPLRRIPLNVSDSRLLGGLDLAATVRTGRIVADRGLLAEADGGVVLLAMAERVSPATAARLALALETGEVILEREGLAGRTSARFGVIALDEGMAGDERLPAVLRDRLAFHVDLSDVRHGHASWRWHTPAEIAGARAGVPHVRARDEVVEVLCQAASALGIASLRAPLLALRIAKAAAALDGRAEVSDDDVALASSLVLAPRATQLPPAADPAPEDAESAGEGDNRQQTGSQDASDATPPDADETPDRELGEVVLEAVQAAIPAGLLARLRAESGIRIRAPSAGRAGAMRASPLRGRPAGVRAGPPGANARLSLIETLRAAAPWQRLRRAESAHRAPPAGRPARILVRSEDFHVTRYRQRAETTTIFAVDASGSAALHRLAEAKGAVELLLAECYVRRDRVAVVAFRGARAELLLPPTRSLARAKRSLAGLPGGGGTPLASGIDEARALAVATLRRGGTPSVVILTDGQANIARDGAAGRAQARADALAAARLLRACGATVIVVDTAPRAQPLARDLADACGGRYLPLPHARADTLSGAILAMAPSPGAGPGRP
jgi:magnesium chelatase subunit D